MTRQKKRQGSQVHENPLEKSLARYRELLEPLNFSLLLEELGSPLVGGLRLNPLKVQPANLQTWCTRYGWKTEPVPFCPSGFRLLIRDTNPGSTLEHRMGAFYLQDVASMLPPELFNFDHMEKPLILDMAASPGGKTTHLIARTEDMGLVISNDGSHSRIPALRSVLQSWGTVNTAITCLPGESFGRNFPEFFDAVLLDAPCSMDGLRATDAHPLRSITDSERASLAHRQTALLRSALQAVRLGGQVVYATCTLAPEENEAVLDTILGMYPGKVEVDDLSIEKNISAPAMIKDGNRDFHPTIRNAFRLWPNTFRTAGFFTARLRKTQPIPQESGNFREKTVPGERPVSLPKSEVDSVVGLLLSAYGIDLELILNLYQLLLVKKKDTILLLPGKLGGRIPTLKFITAGMSLAEITPSGLEISHDFCSRFGKMIPAGWAELPEILNAPWLRGEDIPRDSVSHLPANRIILLRNSEGEYIGRGRVTSDRIKNLLPRRVLL